MSKTVVIVEGVRSPFSKVLTDLRDLAPWELGSSLVRELLARCALDTNAIDEVIFGCVSQPCDTANISRVIAMRAGVGVHVPAYTVGRNCGSGMEAVSQAAEKIASGRAKVVVAGGVESMSQIALQYPLSFGYKLASLMRCKNISEKLIALAALRLKDLKPVQSLVKGLTDPISGDIMGKTADRLAREFNISRSEQDEFALRSHQRVIAHRKELAEEICSIGVGPNFYKYVEEDNGPREGQDISQLSGMRPFFERKVGSVTIGNSSQVTDGGAVLLLMEQEYAESMGYKPLGIIRGHAYRGCDPARMGLGPVYSAGPALNEAGISPQDLDLVELNEAFAAQAIACVRAFESPSFSKEVGLKTPFKIDDSQLNQQGGAIALGHPVGATGTRLVLSLLKQLQRRGGGFGLATLCIGGGQGGSMVLEGVAA